MITSVADQGCLSRILHPNFFHLGSRVKEIPDPGSGYASKNLSILTQKIVSKLGNMIPVVHAGSRSRGRKGTGSRIRIRNTAMITPTFRVAGEQPERAQAGHPPEDQVPLRRMRVSGLHTGQPQNS
jgi:hypothetical protein